MPYQPTETEISRNQLEMIFKQTEDDVCLIGGWAAYYTVNKNFQNANGRNYIGSKDIDIGFHIDTSWSEEHLQRSTFRTTIRLIETMGFRPISFRFCKDFDLETGKELTHEESSKLSLFEFFQLYVDPVVDNVHPKIRQVLGFDPIDEPLLSLVFAERLCTTRELFGSKILLPKPEVLLAMKLNSVIHRDKEHKRIKDITDIYALLWFSDVSITQLKASLLAIYPRAKAKETVRSFTREDISRASETIGVQEGEVKKVLSALG